MAAGNVECVSLDGMLSDAELRVRQQTIDQFTNVTTDELWQRFQLLTTKLQTITNRANLRASLTIKSLCCSSLQL